MRAFAGLVGAQGLHVELDVGTVHVWPRPREDRDLACRERKRPGAPERVLNTDPGAAQRIVHFIVERAFARLEDESHLQMVLQVPADAGQVVMNPHATARRRTSAGPTPEFCRICGEPIAPAARITSACARARRTSPPRMYSTPTARFLFEQHPRGLRPRFDDQVRAVSRGTQKALRGAPAKALVGRLLKIRDAFLRRAVVVVVEGNAPMSWAAAMKCSAIGHVGAACRSDTFSGPPTPWYAFAPRSWSSDFLK